MNQQVELKALLSCLDPRETRERKFVKKNLGKIVGHACYRSGWTCRKRREWIKFCMEDPDMSSFPHPQFPDGFVPQPEPGYYNPNSEIANPEDELLKREAGRSSDREPKDSLILAWKKQVRQVLPESIDEVVATSKPRKNVETALKILLELLLKPGAMMNPELGLRRNGKLNIHHMCKEINEFARSNRKYARKHKLSRQKARGLISDKSLAKWVDVISEVLRRNLERHVANEEP